MEPAHIYYQDHTINLLEFWAMLLDHAQIDAYGRALDRQGQPLMGDDLRYLPNAQPCPWPRYDIFDRQTSQVISEAEYAGLSTVPRRERCERRRYCTLTGDGQEPQRIYFDDAAVSDLIRQGILTGQVPLICTLRAIHGQDSNHNRPGQLYGYRSVILDAFHTAVGRCLYEADGLTDWLLDQVESGYLGWVEQYQLAWLQSIAEQYLEGYRIYYGFGVTALETLRWFVSTDSADLTHYFEQSFETYRTAYERQFPALIDGQIYYRQGNFDYFDAFLDGQRQFLTERLRPAVVQRLQDCFRKYYYGRSPTKQDPEALQSARAALAAALFQA